MKNPLLNNHSEAIETTLVNKSLQGDKHALNRLIQLHQPFIYNVAWKYTNDQEEAKDLTQEVLIKVITKLSSFEGKSSFKTWVYRIVVNQFLQTKRRPMENRWESFDAFSSELNSIPNRTRKEFHAFMNQQCGLVNKDNPCRCSKKAKAMEAAGKMKTNEKLFDPKYTSTISAYAKKVATEVADMVDKKYIEFFQEHPTKEDFNADTVINEIINDKDLHKYFD